MQILKGPSVFAFDRKLLILICLFSPWGASAQIEGVYQVAIKKQVEKKSVRWSLDDWLAQKQRNRLMDLWLVQNSHSSLFEFYLEGHSLNYTQSNVTPNPDPKNYNAYGAALGAYAGVAGLRGGYDSDAENRARWNGSFNLRILGQSMQDTHLNLGYGLRGLAQKSTAGDETFQNQFGHVSLNLYVTKYFGLEGAYDKILPAESNFKKSLEGEGAKAGVFIDFGLLRVFGEWNHEYLSFRDSSGTQNSERRQGFGGGLRFYF